MGAEVSDSEVRRAVTQLLDECGPDPLHERRGADRRPFFRPATVFIDNNARMIHAFTRDISPEGIGLLHSTPLECGMVTIEIHRPSGRPLRFRADIKWCKTRDDPWSISGGRLLYLVD